MWFSGGDKSVIMGRSRSKNGTQRGELSLEGLKRRSSFVWRQPCTGSNVFVWSILLMPQAASKITELGSPRNQVLVAGWESKMQQKKKENKKKKKKKKKI
jgi:hypothetical protein